MLGAAPEGLQGTRHRFDVNPNRPDMLSVEGLARAFRGFLSLETGAPTYEVQPSDVAFHLERRKYKRHSLLGPPAPRPRL